MFFVALIVSSLSSSVVLDDFCCALCRLWCVMSSVVLYVFCGAICLLIIHMGLCFLCCLTGWGVLCVQWCFVSYVVLYIFCCVLCLLWCFFVVSVVLWVSCWVTGVECCV